MFFVVVSRHLNRCRYFTVDVIIFTCSFGMFNFRVTHNFFLLSFICSPIFHVVAVLNHIAGHWHSALLYKWFKASGEQDILRELVHTGRLCQMEAPRIIKTKFENFVISSSSRFLPKFILIAPGVPLKSWSVELSCLLHELVRAWTCRLDFLNAWKVGWSIHYFIYAEETRRQWNWPMWGWGCWISVYLKDKTDCCYSPLRKLASRT